MKKYLIYICLIVLLFGCKSEPLKITLVTKDELNIPVISPCTYLDTASIEGVNTKYNVDIEFRDNFDYEEYRLSFTSASDILVFEYRSIYGFDEIKSSKEFDLSASSKLNVYLVKYGSFGYTYRAIEGKVYLTVLPNGKKRIDWCDITLKDNSSSIIKKSYGGFLFRI